MNAHQRRVAKRLYERAFGTHVDYYIEVPTPDEAEPKTAAEARGTEAK